jgi:hypothetical protein
MALTKEELIRSLQNEVRILLHLCTKVEPRMLDYRPTPKQRSTLELLRYLSIMGRGLVSAAKTGAFDGAAWSQAAEVADQKNFDEVVDAIASLSEFYATELGPLAEGDFATEIEMFGNKMSRGAFLVNLVLCGHAAYRTQLFCYLKACGREELNTLNLWQGIDGEMPAAS